MLAVSGGLAIAVHIGLAVAVHLGSAAVLTVWRFTSRAADLVLLLEAVDAMGVAGHETLSDSGWLADAVWCSCRPGDPAPVGARGYSGVHSAREGAELATSWDSEHATNRFDALIDALCRGVVPTTGACVEIGSGTGQRAVVDSTSWARTVRYSWTPRP
ncbi:MAG: hypothetical protein ACRDQ6_12700 [Pseudonocardiaceae bacterium]